MQRAPKIGEAYPISPDVCLLRDPADPAAIRPVRCATERAAGTDPRRRPGGGERTEPLAERPLREIKVVLMHTEHLVCPHLGEATKSGSSPERSRKGADDVLPGWGTACCCADSRRPSRDADSAPRSSVTGIGSSAGTGAGRSHTSLQPVLLCKNDSEMTASRRGVSDGGHGLA